MTPVIRSFAALAVLLVGWTGPPAPSFAAGPEGTLTIARKEYQDKRLRPIVQSGSATFGNAATRLDAFVASTGPFTYGTYPDIEGLMRELAGEFDRGKRETILHRIQQLVHEKVMYAPIWEQAGIGAFGPRVEEPAIGLITNMATSAPYEDLRLKSK